MGLSPDQIKLYQWLLASVLTLSAVDRGLSPDQIKLYQWLLTSVLALSAVDHGAH
jgi:hypothetical protein